MPRLLIVTPAPTGSTKGNRITAERWATFLLHLGHEVVLDVQIRSGSFDCLITLHATRSHDVITAFERQCPGKPVILCLTGTDMHLDLQRIRGEDAFKRASIAIEKCHRIVLLEPEGLKLLPAETGRKTTVIRQSANPVADKLEPLAAVFEICVLGHLRDEKDPFLVSYASKRLSTASKVAVSHFGAALSPELEKTAREQMETNRRYKWLGGVSHEESQRCLTRSRLMVLTSKTEGAPSVISEAIVNDVPILATKIPATVGLLGLDYPGFLPVGDVDALTKLIARSESDPKFLDGLKKSIQRLKPQFAPDVEREGLRQMLAGIIE